MYEEKDREQMNQDEREERKVNWTTPQKLEEGRSTDCLLYTSDAADEL
mgnify:CR=1 FL=1